MAMADWGRQLENDGCSSPGQGGGARMMHVSCGVVRNAVVKNKGLVESTEGLMSVK